MLTLKTIQALQKQSKGKIWKDCDELDVLQHLVIEQIEKENQYIDNLKQYTKAGNMYTAINMIGTEALKSICDDKIANYEKRLYFKDMKQKYCNNLDLLTDASIEQASQVEIRTILLHLTDLQISRNRSKCPICNNQNNKTVFSFKNNLFNCFKCGAKGNSIKLFELLTGNNFKETVKNLNKI